MLMRDRKTITSSSSSSKIPPAKSHIQIGRRALIRPAPSPMVASALNNMSPPQVTRSPTPPPLLLRVSWVSTPPPFPLWQRRQRIMRRMPREHLLTPLPCLHHVVHLLLTHPPDLAYTDKAPLAEVDKAPHQSRHLQIFNLLLIFNHLPIYNHPPTFRLS